MRRGLFAVSAAYSAVAFDSRNVSDAEWVCDGSPLLKFGAESIKCGSEVLWYESQTRPTFWFYNADPGAFYTLIVVDRDATSAQDPSRSPLRHFATPHVPGALLATHGLTPDAALPEAWFNFSGPRPPPGTGCHRYYAIVYEEDPDVFPTLYINASDPNNRLNWDFPTWAQNNSLTKVGVNFWATQAAETRTGPCFPGPDPDGNNVDPVGIAAGTVGGALVLCAVGVCIYRQRRTARKGNSQGGWDVAGAVPAGTYETMGGADWT